MLKNIIKPRFLSTTNSNSSIQKHTRVQMGGAQSISSAKIDAQELFVQKHAQRTYENLETAHPGRSRPRISRRPKIHQKTDTTTTRTSRRACASSTKNKTDTTTTRTDTTCPRSAPASARNTTPTTATTGPTTTTSYTPTGRPRAPRTRVLKSLGGRIKTVLCRWAIIP